MNSKKGLNSNLSSYAKMKAKDKLTFIVIYILAIFFALSIALKNDFLILGILLLGMIFIFVRVIFDASD